MKRFQSDCRDCWCRSSRVIGKVARAIFVVVSVLYCLQHGFLNLYLHSALVPHVLLYLSCTQTLPLSFYICHAPTPCPNCPSISVTHLPLVPIVLLHLSCTHQPCIKYPSISVATVRSRCKLLTVSTTFSAAGSERGRHNMETTIFPNSGTQ